MLSHFARLSVVIAVHRRLEVGSLPKLRLWIRRKLILIKGKDGALGGKKNVISNCEILLECTAVTSDVYLRLTALSLNISQSMFKNWRSLPLCSAAISEYIETRVARGTAFELPSESTPKNVSCMYLTLCLYSQCSYFQLLYLFLIALL